MKKRSNDIILSIIIPVYNSELFLEKLLKDLVNKPLNNFEIILINDGSTDKTKLICEKYEKKYNFIKYINKKNTGVSSSRNLGINYSKGKYIYFCDADDRLYNNIVEYIISTMSSIETDLLSFNYYKICDDKELNFTINKTMTYYGKNEYIDRIINDKQNIISGFLWNKVFIKDIIMENNIRFDETLSIIEDSLFVIQYCKHCKKISHNESTLYAYRIHPNSITNQSFGVKTISATFGQAKVYSYLKLINLSDKTKKNMWEKAVESALFSYSKIVLSHNKQYFCYKKEIKNVISQIKNDYSFMNILNLKNIFRLYIYIFF